MKKVFIFLFIVNLCFAQNNNLKYEDLQNPEFYKTVKKGQRFDSYLDKNNNLVKVNDELTVGKPENPQNVTKNFQNVSVYGNFSNIRKYKAFIFTAEKQFSNEKAVIKSISVEKQNILKKYSPLNVNIEIQLKKKLDLIELLYVDNFDKALEMGEVIFDNGFMTKEKAIALLKEKKELLDLGIISQEAYDKIKIELTPLILGENK